MKELAFNRIKLILASSKDFLFDSIRKYDNEKLAQVYNNGYLDAKRKYTANAISALCEANIDHDKIIRIVTSRCDTTEQEIRHIINEEEINISLKVIQSQLKLYKFSNNEIDRFLKEYDVVYQLENNADLWKLKEDPIALFNAVKKNKKGA